LTENRAPVLVAGAKDVGVMLTSASAVAYASGYLALRARAHALGTDPGFTLVDQAYVFAGFRFALDTLVALLVIAPLLILIRSILHRLFIGVKPGGSRPFAWIAAIALAFLTLASFATLGVSAVLVSDPAPSGDVLQRALTSSILGTGDLGVLITLAATFTAALTVLWARGRYVQVGPTDPLTAVLIVMAVIQLVLLPVQHGIFYADRNARMLARVPDGLVGVSPPVWLLDRGADRASLIARSAGGRLGLITVKVDALDGIPVTQTMPIGDIVRGRGAP
jgi:hypothetical protein